MEDYKELTRKYIMKRENIPPQMFSVRLMLRSAGMEEYAESCVNRIFAENLVDGEHVNMDYFDLGNVSLDEDGLFDCKDILEGYIEHETLTDYYVYLCQVNKVRASLNNTIEVARSFSKKELKECIKNAPKLPQYSDDVIAHAKAELRSRSILNMAWIKLKKKIITVYTLIRYRWLFALMEMAAIDYKMRGQSNG